MILAGGAHAFTATDTISIGTSAASNTLSVTVPTNAANTQTPAAPVVTNIAENSDQLHHPDGNGGGELHRDRVEHRGDQ